MSEKSMLVIAILVVLGIVIYFRIREARYLKKKTSEVMSDTLRREIEKEREAALEKKRLFDTAMAQARKNQAQKEALEIKKETH